MTDPRERQLEEVLTARSDEHIREMRAHPADESKWRPSWEALDRAIRELAEYQRASQDG